PGAGGDVPAADRHPAVPGRACHGHRGPAAVEEGQVLRGGDEQRPGDTGGDVQLHRPGRLDRHPRHPAAELSQTRGKIAARYGYSKRSHSAASTPSARATGAKSPECRITPPRKKWATFGKSMKRGTT